MPDDKAYGYHRYYGYYRPLCAVGNVNPGCVAPLRKLGRAGFRAARFGVRVAAGGVAGAARVGARAVIGAGRVVGRAGGFLLFGRRFH